MRRVKGEDRRNFYLPGVTIREALRAFPDVVPISVRSGQILVYPRHIPPGVFVVLGGILLRGGDSLDAAAGPFAIPGPAELGEPAASDVVAGTDLEILFVPRSVALRDGRLARLFELAHVPILPLQNGRAR